MSHITSDFRNCLDQQPITRYQYVVLTLLFFLLFTDGYDAQTLGYVVPAMAIDWGVDKAAFGIAFSANLLGLACGSFVIPPIADRLGARRILIACVAVYGGLTVLSALLESLPWLVAARFLTGVGMGGAMPCAMALMADYAPPRLRTMMVTLAASGFALGGAIGGFIAVAFINQHGWQAVFLFGGVTPLLLIPFLIPVLPESLARLIQRGAPYAELKRVTQRILPDWEPSSVSLESGNSKYEGLEKNAWNSLFKNGYAKATLLIWGAFFIALILLYFIISWLPSLLVNSGMKMEEANLFTSLFLFSGAIGGPTLSFLIDKFKYRKSIGLGLILSGAAAAMMFLGLNAEHATTMLIGVVIGGFCIIGGQLTLNAFVSAFYPPHMRAMGAGWALGVGRIGSIIAPLLGSLFLMAKLEVSTIFMLCAIPALAAGFLISQVRQPEKESGYGKSDRVRLTDTAL